MDNDSSGPATDDEQIERQKQEKASWKQKLFIERLDGSASSNLTKYDASQLIDKLSGEQWRVVEIVNTLAG